MTAAILLQARLSPVVEVTERAVLDRIFRLRVDAWREHVAVPDGMVEWRDHHDEVGRHFAILCGDEPVAAARLTVHSSIEDLPEADAYRGILASNPVPVAAFSRCVVHPEYRGRGLARQLDLARLEAARVADVKRAVVHVHAQERIPRLCNLGFAYGGEGARESAGTFVEGLRSLVLEAQL